MPEWIVYLLIGFLIFDSIVIYFVLSRRRRVRSFRAEEHQYIRSHWIRILDMSKNNMMGAILDADKLLDYALTKHGFQGTLGEKLKKSGPRFSDLNGVWSAHKLRNQAAHEMGNVDHSRGKMALQQFKRALNDLGANL